MKKRLLLQVLTGLLVSALLGSYYAASQTSTHPPPDKPLPVPIIAQESRPFPRPAEIFIVSPDYGVWAEYYQNGTKPELVVKIHPTAIGLTGEQVRGTAPYYCEDCYRYNTKIVHEWGMKHFSQINTETHASLNEVDPQTRASLLQAGCVSIDGDPIGSMDADLYKLCTNNPVWQEYLIEMSKRSIALGKLHISSFVSLL